MDDTTQPKKRGGSKPRRVEGDKELVTVALVLHREQVEAITKLADAQCNGNKSLAARQIIGAGLKQKKTLK